MNKNKYTFMGSFTSKLSFVLLFTLIGVTDAIAENILKMEPFSIKPGEEKSVAVDLENSDAVSALQMDFTLPNGLSITACKRNGDRLVRGMQSSTLSLIDSVEPYRYRVLITTITSADRAPFVGNSGSIVYLTIKASSSFNKPGYIKITEALASNFAAASLPIANSTVKVSPKVASFSIGEKNISIKPDSTLRKISFQLSNDIKIYGMQGEITLPKGMSITKFDYTDRLPDNATIGSNTLENGKVRFLISDLDPEAFNGNLGELFSFKVKADKNLALLDSVKIDNVIVSDVDGNAYNVDGSASVNIKNTYLAEYIPVKAKFDTLMVAYEAAVTKIAKDYADVVKDSAIVAQGNKIGSSISTAQTAIEDSYAKDNLANDSASILLNIKQAQADVDKWIAAAAAAEKVFVDTKANKEANEAANTKLTAAITAVQAKMDAAKTTIATDCKDVVDQFVSVEKTIQTKIDSIKTSVKALYDAVKLTAESTVDTVAINTAIANMVTDATAAEKAFVDAKAKKEANEAANTKLTAAIAAVQAKLDAAKTTITTDCPAVVNHYVPVISDIIQEHINLKTDSVKAKYDAVELTAESTVDLTSIEIAIAQMVTDAKAEQKSISTGIYGIISTDPNVQIFSISGQKLTVPVKGAINIIKFSNGQTKKIFVK